MTYVWNIIFIYNKTADPQNWGNQNTRTGPPGVYIHTS